MMSGAAGFFLASASDIPAFRALLSDLPQGMVNAGVV
jgi:hypothetical protein